MPASDLARQAVDRLMGGQLDAWLRAHVETVPARKLPDLLRETVAADGRPIGVRVTVNTLRRWAEAARADN